MATMPITAVYAAILALLLVALSIRVIMVRRRAQVAVGDGADPTLARAIRAQANLSEYAPLALLLLLLLELNGAGALWVHVLGAMLLIGRLIHAWGISQADEDFRFRVTGMTLTFLALIGTAIGILIRAI
jgi:uncharacterized membrane protein YecN with MAPEG domain